MPTAIVLGGGIGGLAAAIALRRIGWQANVYERAPEIREVGAGLTLWCNAMQAIDRLGLMEPVLARASILSRGETRTAAGRLIMHNDLAGYEQWTGYPTVGVHRAELQKTLAEALPAESIHTDCQGTQIEQSATGVTVRFANGRTATGDVLIGADGIRSVVRQTLADPGPLRYAGYAAWRGITSRLPDSQKPDEVRFAVGKGTQMGILPCGPGRVYWFITRNGPAGGEDPPGGHREAILQSFADWHPDFRGVIEGTPESTIIRGDILDRPPSDFWGKDRISLLGDAIHATTPNLGQGACMALEDAVVLADRLRHAEHPIAGLRDYENARKARTAFIVKQSWMMGKVLQLDTGWLCWLRDRISASKAGQRQSDRLLRKLVQVQLPVL
ncbi:FAD-dependent monooxygenase [Tuwongella immobilis]|uniref:FAD-binding domain-containing protein n=1 Tax=Tuwongella immobilis TaxID=692036 RepID=A0A6C2YIL3_9BACT|nr:FAD-dependent monooxygenase [Tuwongella immobilis]VIP01257.1 fad-dependent oxidoreductase : Zeaxanthin epoxidase OS=Sphaerobacter thermophilus (strain DSM 20745 / S 6022) GN=Sthe_3373 PE=4 SV=1: FAD_binding_3 [Tuwongella immobilis]VTR97940.1 fad-dependent oxidoreductase : Zeaxanthin epoxidase OS=Sphaerobacter thermophilus (strain DSM 20745 / S 6022) GN=Sthe_3373 PE=4 SV=1: FAD_binding_3 [Tuwongella immobilis]